MRIFGYGHTERQRDFLNLLQYSYIPEQNACLKTEMKKALQKTVLKNTIQNLSYERLNMSKLHIFLRDHQSSFPQFKAHKIRSSLTFSVVPQFLKKIRSKNPQFPQCKQVCCQQTCFTQSVENFGKNIKKLTDDAKTMKLKSLLEIPRMRISSSSISPSHSKMNIFFHKFGLQGLLLENVSAFWS